MEGDGFERDAAEAEGEDMAIENKTGSNNEGK